MFKTSKDVVVKGSDGKQQASQPYDKVVFHGTSLDKEGAVISDGVAPEKLFSDAVAFLQKDDPKTNPILNLLDLATYAYDLNVRSKIRQGLVAGLEGPDKAIEKAANDLVKARAASGKPITLEAARAKVAAIMAE